MKQGVFVRGIETNVSERLWEFYHENSKNRTSTSSLAQTTVTGSKEGALNSTYRFAESRCIGLAPIQTRSGMDLQEAIQKRRSSVGFSGAPIGVSELGQLLFAMAGITAEVGGGRKSVPSAGALYPLELFVLVRAVESIPVGLFHYQPNGHYLEQLTLGPHRDEDLFIQGEVSGAAALFLLAASFERLSVKYGERGYRYCLLEAGHSMQNAALVAGALSLGFCPLGGFFDDSIDELLGHDGFRQSVVYAGAVGTNL